MNVAEAVVSCVSIIAICSFWGFVIWCFTKD